MTEISVTQSRSINVRIWTNADDIARKLGNMKKQTGRVMARAANDTAHKKAVTEIKRATAKVFIVRQSDVAAAVAHTSWATAGNPTAIITFSGVRTNMMLMGGSANLVTPTKEQSGRLPRFVRTHAMRGHGKVPLMNSPRPFVRHGRLMQRKVDEPHYPILMGRSAPAIPQDIANEESQAGFMDTIAQYHIKRLEHYISGILSGASWA